MNRLPITSTCWARAWYTACRADLSPVLLLPWGDSWGLGLGGCPKPLTPVNLIGSFNIIILAAATSANEPENTGECRVLISTTSEAAYAVMVGLTLPIACDLARNAISNMTIAPGTVGTPMLPGMPQEVCRTHWPQACPCPATPQDYAKLGRGPLP